jgi:hypothetical protein
MGEIIVALRDTPMPVVLAGGGLIFIFLAVVGKFGGSIELSPNRKWAGFIGMFLLLSGLALYVAPVAYPLLNTPAPTATPTADGADISAYESIDSLMGTWQGAAVSGRLSTRIKIDIQRPCEVGLACGEFYVPELPCSYTLVLKDITDEGFVFSGQRQQGICGSEREDILQLVSENELRWKSSRGTASGLLQKTSDE